MKPSNAYMRHYNIPTLLQIMACCLRRVKPVSEPMLPYFKINPMEYISVKTYIKCKCSHSRKYRWKCRLLNCSHFFWASMCWYQSINIFNLRHKIGFKCLLQHDYNMIAILSALGVWDQLIPPYSSYLSVELHEANNGGHVVKIFYKNDTNTDYDSAPRQLIMPGMLNASYVVHMKYKRTHIRQQIICC